MGNHDSSSPAAAAPLPDGRPQHASRWRLALAAIVSIATDEKRFPRLSLFVQTTVGLALFLAIEPFFAECNHLPFQVYHRPFIGLAALKLLKVWVPLGFVLTLLIAGRRSLGWDRFDLHRQTRWLVCTLAGVLAFAYSLYSYNYYFDHTHLGDRLLLVAYAILVYRHPAFAGLIVLQAFIVVGQFDTMVRCTWIDKLLIFELLVLFTAFLTTKMLFRRQGFAPFLTAAMIVVGTFYLRSGLGKLDLDWLSINHLERLFLSASHQNGWLAWLGPQWVDAIHGAMRRCSKPLMLGTLFVELGVIALLVHRRYAMFVLGCCCLMHVGIFVSSGILFWKWTALDIVLFVVAWRLPPDAGRRIFGWPALVLALAMLALNGIYDAPPSLSWYDSSMCYRFIIEAVGESGEIYQVPPYRLAPYDVAFAQARFYYITQRAQLAGCMGALQCSNLFDAIERVDDRHELEVLRKHQGTVSYSRRGARRFDKLLYKYFVWERRRQLGERRVFPIKSPAHIWTFAHPDLDREVYTGQEPIVSVNIRLDESLQRFGKLITMSDEVVRTIDVTPGAAPGDGSIPQLADSQRTLVK